MMAMRRDYDYLFKIVLLGDSGVGKSSILLRFVDDLFDGDTRLTQGIDFRFKTINIDSKCVKLHIWDIGSPVEEITEAYHRGAHIYILIYSGGDMMDSINKYATKIEEVWRKQERSRKLKVLLLENKSDINDHITTNAFFNRYKRMIEEKYSMNIPYGIMQICEMYYGVISWGQRLAMEKEWLFYRVSAKTGENIDDAFRQITRMEIQERVQSATEWQSMQQADTYTRPKPYCCIL